MRLILFILIIFLALGSYALYSILTIDRTCVTDYDCVRSQGCGCIAASDKCYFGDNLPLNDCVCVNGQCQEELIRGCRKAKEFCTKEGKNAMYDGKSCIEWLEKC